MVAFFLYLFQVIVLTGLSWITKANIARKNLNKIKSPDTSSITDKIMMYGLMILFNVALSWIGVAMSIWAILVLLFNSARELLTSVPEEIKFLRYPIKNNPNLSSEAVWAYAVALNLRTGTEWSEGLLSNELNNIADDYPAFNPQSAIKLLEGLKVVDQVSTKRLADRVKIRFDD
ncbi:MAG: hypothetical protein NTW57_03235 [Methylophilales bacterium]|nr:hypothetical protein [Methylophilales bacterium]